MFLRNEFQWAGLEIQLAQRWHRDHQMCLPTEQVQEEHMPDRMQPVSQMNVPMQEL